MASSSVQMLTGQVVMVCGSQGALGSVVANTLAQRGAQVVGLDRRANSANPCVRLALHHPALTEAAALADLFSQTLRQCGRLDGVVNCIGAFRLTPVAGTDLHVWDTLLTSNLRIPVALTRQAIRTLTTQNGGHIVHVGAAIGTHTPAGLAAYAASKSGLQKLVEASAEETREQGIAINSISPGTIDTPANRAAMPDTDTRSWVRPERIASLIADLLAATQAPSGCHWDTSTVL